MIRSRKLFSRPKKAYEKGRIAEENSLKKKYALKSKREIWRTIAKLKHFRDRAKALAKDSPEQQEILFKKLRAIGLNTNTISDVLSLSVENILERRLPTVMFKKGIASTVKEARQMVAHKRVLINGRAINAPSYLVNVADEGSITLKLKARTPKAEEAPSEASPESQTEGGSQ